MPDTIEYVAASKKISSLVCEEFNTLSTATFNDAPERTHAEVLEACRKAGI